MLRGMDTQPPSPAATAVYARISQDRGGGSLGVDRQVELCRELADQKGWEVVEVYIDNDVSAYAGKPRPEYERLLEDLRSGARDAVVCVDQDRLTRHVRELEDFVDLAERHGIALANVSGDLDLATSDGRFRARIMGAVARQESEKKSERLKRETAQRARRGRPHGGRRPYGYERDGMTIRDDEAAIIRELARRLLAGESLPTLARDLNSRGVLTARGRDLIDDGRADDARGKKWRTTSVRSILASPRLAALRVHQGEVVGEAEWPPILDRVTHERIKAILGDPRRSQSGRPPEQLLTSLLRCGRCGCVMHSSRRSGSGHRRFACHPSAGSGACGRTAIATDALEDVVRDLVIQALAGPGLMAAAADPASDAEVTGLAEQVATDEAALEQLARDHYADRIITRAEYMAARGALENRISAAQDRISAATLAPTLRDLPTDVDGLRAAWDAADVAWRRSLATAVLDHIDIGPGTQGRHSLDLERLRPVWRA